MSSIDSMGSTSSIDIMSSICSIDIRNNVVANYFSKRLKNSRHRFE